MGYYANKKEIDFFLNENENSKREYYYIMIFIFLVVVIISGYYSYQGYIEVLNKKTKIYSKQKEYTNLNFISNTLALISALIYLYIAITDTNIEAEISLS